MPVDVAPRIIRDRKRYEAFVAMLPADAQSARPVIDFSTHALVVAIRGDTMHMYPELSDPKKKGAHTVVEVHYPPLGSADPDAVRLGLGTYRAAVVPSSVDTLVLRVR
jgi:hypothetical protein